MKMLPDELKSHAGWEQKFTGKQHPEAKCLNLDLPNLSRGKWGFPKFKFARIPYWGACFQGTLTLLVPLLLLWKCRKDPRNPLQGGCSLDEAICQGQVRGTDM